MEQSELSLEEIMSLVESISVEFTPDAILEALRKRGHHGEADLIEGLHDYNQELQKQNELLRREVYKLNRRVKRRSQSRRKRR